MAKNRFYQLNISLQKRQTEPEQGDILKPALIQAQSSNMLKKTALEVSYG